MPCYLPHTYLKVIKQHLWTATDLFKFLVFKQFLQQRLKALKMHWSLERTYPTPLSNSTLLPLLLLSLTKQRHSPVTSAKIRREYDYIIVGSGSAGSVVASRLSELPCVSVLLIEAGGEPPLLTEVPALGESFRLTDVDWQYKTAPQKYTGRALINRQMVWPSGKMLGGSSVLSSLLYVRGNKRNYDDWADQGAEGWSFKDVYPYFLKLENNKDREFLANGYHTTGGPVSVHKPRYEPELKRAVYRAAVGMGYKVVDSNADKQTGFYDHQATLRDSQRCSTAKAYLVPAENRTNLDILSNAMVTKVIIQKRQARGVQFDYEGHAYEVQAKKEVIVSAGTVNTAQLLMLSGVGPKEELRRLNIPVIMDLPVGQNLQDHAGTDIPFVLPPRSFNFEEKISDPANIDQYVRNRTGPLSSTEGVNFLAFLKGQAIYSPDDFPNYELYFKEMTASTVRDQYGLKPEVYRRLYGPYENKPLFVCRVSLLQPRSRGSVTLRSKNPHDSPIIDPNFLQDFRDVEDLVQGMKTCQRIGTRFPLRRLGAKPFKTLIPGCEKYDGDEDKYFTCQLRSILLSFSHPVGTIKMGDPRDATTVVDPELRVKNIKGLRVVDASIMPIIPSGDTMIPTIVVAEKASEMIKENIRCYRKDYEDWDEPEDSSEWSGEEKPDVNEWDKSNEDSWENEYQDVTEWDKAKEVPQEKDYQNAHEWHKTKEIPQQKDYQNVHEWHKTKEVPKEKDYQNVHEWHKTKEVPREKDYQNVHEWHKTKEVTKVKDYQNVHEWDKTKKVLRKNKHQDVDEWEKPTEIPRKNKYQNVKEWGKYKEVPRKNKYQDINEWEKHKEVSEENKYQDINEWEKPKEVSKKNEYQDSSEHSWNAPEKETRSENEEKSLEDYLKYPGDLQHTEKDHSQEEHLNGQTPKYSGNDKYYLDDYIKNSEELSEIKNEKDDFWRPYSWYKKQTDLILKEINRPWKTPFKMTKSLEELVKLADMNPDDIDKNYKWSKSREKPEVPCHHSY